MSFMNILIPWGLSFIGLLLCIPFFTLLERKILSYSQSRKGPKKVGYLGLLQPISDGMKLIMKEGGKPWNTNKMVYWLSPFISFMMMVFCTFLFPMFWSGYSLRLGMVLYLVIMSTNVYFIMSSGLGSKSKYTLLGAIRGSAQSISYEISFLITIMLPLCLCSSYKINFILSKSKLILFLAIPVFMIWVMSMLAETNRAPFDFAEGESELVSGFKTEYGALPFTLLFLSEYGSMLFMSMITYMLYMYFNMFYWFVFCKLFFIYFIWCRSSFPRFRYDLLMTLSWKMFLPVSLFYLWVVFLL